VLPWPGRSLPHAALSDEFLNTTITEQSTQEDPPHCTCISDLRGTRNANYSIQLPSRLRVI